SYPQAGANQNEGLDTILVRFYPPRCLVRVYLWRCSQTRPAGRIELRVGIFSWLAGWVWIPDFTTVRTGLKQPAGQGTAVVCLIFSDCELRYNISFLLPDAKSNSSRFKDFGGILAYFCTEFLVEHQFAGVLN